MDKIKKVSAALKNIFTFLVLLPVPVAIVMWTYVQFREQSVFGIPIVGGPSDQPYYHTGTCLLCWGTSHCGCVLLVLWYVFR